MPPLHDKIIHGDGKIVNGGCKIVPGDEKMADRHKKMVHGHGKMTAGNGKIINGHGKMTHGDRKIIPGLCKRGYLNTSSYNKGYCKTTPLLSINKKSLVFLPGFKIIIKTI